MMLEHGICTEPDVGGVAPEATGEGMRHDSLAAPTKIVGRSYGSGRIGLGLDQPFELLGGDRLDPLGVASKVALDWIPGMAPLLAGACRSQVNAGRRWFHLPPLALVGAPGTGRGHVARQLARCAGVPLIHFDISRVDLVADAQGETEGLDVSLPQIPVLAMAAARCANPIVLVAGVENATAEALAMLVRMLDVESSARWSCEPLGAVLDLSAVSWLVATWHEEGLENALHRRLEVLRIDDRPSGNWHALRAMGIALEAMADLRADPADLSALMSPLDPNAAWAGLERLTADAIYAAVRRILEGFTAPG